MKTSLSKFLDAARWMAIPVLMGFLTYPVGRWLVRQWLTNEYYSHGMLVLLVSGYFAWQAQRQSSAPLAPADTALVFLAAGTGLYLLGETLIARYISALALILIAAGLIAFLRGWKKLQQMAFPLAYFVFAIPFPFVDGLAIKMGTLTAAWATLLVRVFGIAAVNEGNQITLPSCSLVVGAPCSGLRSLVALLALVAVWIYIARGSKLARAILLLTAIPLAALSNLLRITSLLWIAERWGVETALNYYHDFSGPIFFALAAAGLFATSWVLKCRDLRSDI